MANEWRKIQKGWIKGDKKGALIGEQQRESEEAKERRRIQRRDVGTC